MAGSPKKVRKSTGRGTGPPKAKTKAKAIGKPPELKLPGELVALESAWVFLWQTLGEAPFAEGLPPTVMQ